MSSELRIVDDVAERLSGWSPERRAALARRVQERRGGTPPPELRRVSRSGPLPLSFAQRRLWLLSRLDPHGASYNMPYAVRLGGRLDTVSLHRALDEVVRRHESLRTSFTLVGGEPMQRVDGAPEWPLTVVDLSGGPEAAREGEVRRRRLEEARRPFDLSSGPLVRGVLLRLTDVEHVLLLTLHHIVTDGWSAGILFRELAALYAAFAAGRPSPLPDLPIQYADFACWQREWLRGHRVQPLLEYWKTHLAAPLPVLELPADRPRPAVQTDRGRSHTRVLGREVLEAVRTLSRREGVTTFMTLLAAFETWLHRYTGHEDMVVGTPIAGRNRTEVEGLIGFFVNTLAMRTDLSGNPTFRELLARVKDVTLAAYAHQELPFETLVEELQPERSLSRTPLFQPFFNMVDTTEAPIHVPGLTWTSLEFVEHKAKFDVTLYASERHDRLTLRLVYNADLYGDARMERMLDQFGRLLTGALEDPGRRLSGLPLLSPEERRATASPVREDAYRRGSIPERFSEQVRRGPDRVAIRARDGVWTYEALNRRANQVAHALRTQAPSAERVALLLSSDGARIAALLGVLKAGMAYVPLDPAYPAERLRDILSDADPSILLTERDVFPFAEALGGGRPVLDLAAIGASWPSHDPSTAPGPDAVAYLLYTSGSSGRPKGVVQSHENVLHFAALYADALTLGPDDRLTLFSSYSHDAAVVDIFAALLSGASLHPRNLARESWAGLDAWIEREGITVYHSVPTVFREVVASAAPPRLGGLRWIVLGGEQVVASDVEQWAGRTSPACRLVNLYGSTECSISLLNVLSRDGLESGARVGLGRAVSRTEVVLVDRAGDETEILGEIAVRSPHVALGYWRRPEETRRAFHGEGAARTYRTGDLGRRTGGSEGFECLGREDFQVKVRGVRIEPREIEARLEAEPNVKQAIVVARADDGGETRLVAYVLTRDGSARPEAWRQALARALPELMIPSAFVQLDAFPLTPGRKIDRRALPAPRSYATEGPRVQPPESPVQEELAAIWSELLRVESVGIHDSFFALGGHSLLAVRVLSRVKDRLGVDLSLKEVFLRPTLAGLAEAVEEALLVGCDEASAAAYLAALEAVDDEEAREALSAGSHE
jgi:amino acid adenylation domain-containing protein